MGAQWFPKAGVYEGDRWNCRAYHPARGFYADFGTYDVDLSLPNALLLAHTGTPTNFKTAEDITPDPKRPANVIWKLHAEDVHDFAWAVMPRRAGATRPSSTGGSRCSASSSRSNPAASSARSWPSRWP